MDPESELCSAGTDSGRNPNLVNAGSQPSNVNLGTELNLSTLPPRSSAFFLSDRENHHHLHPLNLQYHNSDNDNGSHLPHQYSEPLTMSEPSPSSEARASGLDPTRTPPIGATKPSHRTPYQHLSLHPDPPSSDIRRSLSDDQLRKLGGGGPPFSSPLLHPMSLRVKSSRDRSPFSASAQRSKGGRKQRTRFTVSKSPHNSPVESGSEDGYHVPKPLSSPFTVRGFLALSTFSKVIALLFACCALLLLRAFLGIGHSAESCGVYAHEVTRSGSPSESSALGLDASHLKLPTDTDKLSDQKGKDARGRVRLEIAVEDYGYKFDWKSGEYEIEHEEDGGDPYDDEYEHDDFLD